MEDTKIFKYSGIATIISIILFILVVIYLILEKTHLEYVIQYYLG